MVKREKTPATRTKELIVSSKRILLSLHRNPDGDSIASCLAMSHYLHSLGLGKEVTLIAPGPVPANFDFLPHFREIKVGQDIFTLNQGDFNLLIILDCASLSVLSDKEIPSGFSLTKPTINIDHHQANLEFGKINLVNRHASSTCEVLYDLFREWNVSLGQDLALCLLTGIVTDTGGFHYPNTTATILGKASDLIAKGVDLRSVMFNFLRRVELLEMRYWGLALRKLEVDESGRYTKILLSYSDLRKIGDSRAYRESTANLFLQILEGTEFGYILAEDEPGLIRGSLRARTGFDVSKIAVALGGGGHAGAAGFVLRDMSFKEAQERVEKAIKRVI